MRELGTASEAPQSPDVHDSGDDVSTHDAAVPSRDLASRTRAVHDEEVAEELVPAFAPELRHGRGHPGPVRDARPLRRGLTQHDLAEERAALIHDVDGGVDEDHSANGNARYLEEARKNVEGLIKDGVTLEAVRGWTDQLHGVVRSVERGDFEKKLEELCGN